MRRFPPKAAGNSSRLFNQLLSPAVGLGLALLYSGFLLPIFLCILQFFGYGRGRTKEASPGPPADRFGPDLSGPTYSFSLWKLMSKVTFRKERREAEGGEKNRALDIILGVV